MNNVGAWMRRERVGGGGVSGQDVRERNPKSLSLRISGLEGFEPERSLNNPKAIALHE